MAEKKIVSETKSQLVVSIPLVVRLSPIVVEVQTVLIVVDVEDVRVAVTICVIVCSATRGTAHVICLRKRHQAVFYL